jgi:hypothetical protein
VVLAAGLLLAAGVLVTVLAHRRSRRAAIRFLAHLKRTATAA